MRSIKHEVLFPSAFSAAVDGITAVDIPITADDKLSAYTRFEFYVSLRTLTKHPPARAIRARRLLLEYSYV